MTLLAGTIFITNDPFDAAYLEEAIADAIAYRREHGKRHNPTRLYILESELHMLAATDRRHAAQPVATPTPPKRGASGTMSVVEASRILKKSGQMIRRYCESGVLDAVKVRNVWRIDGASVEALKARSQKSA